MERKVLVITAFAPFGSGETFILTELDGVISTGGVSVIVCPRQCKGKRMDAYRRSFLDKTLVLPVLTFKMTIRFIFDFLCDKKTFQCVKEIILSSRNAFIAIKNLCVLPKAFHISTFVKQYDICHIHAHWGSTTGTMGYFISRIAKVPWSFTLHRWDIYENNILSEKVKNASFVRCISEKGKRDLLGIVGSKYSDRVRVVHMGVDVPAVYNSRQGSSAKIFEDTQHVLLIPANLLPVKGHKYLLEACKILKEKKYRICCIIAGDGPLKNELIHIVNKEGLQDSVIFAGRLPHKKILEMYGEGKIFAVIVPSVLTDDGQHEGIPVALAEAMAYGIPVVSTNTGSISELIDGGAGIIVEQKNGVAIADAVETLILHPETYDSVRRAAKERVGKDFNSVAISAVLTGLFIANSDLA